MTAIFRELTSKSAVRWSSAMVALARQGGTPADVRPIHSSDGRLYVCRRSASGHRRSGRRSVVSSRHGKENLYHRSKRQPAKPLFYLTTWRPSGIHKLPTSSTAMKSTRSQPKGGFPGELPTARVTWLSSRPFPRSYPTEVSGSCLNRIELRGRIAAAKFGKSEPTALGQLGSRRGRTIGSRSGLHRETRSFSNGK